MTYFGPVLSPAIGLAEALMLGLLVPYDYRLHEVSLDEDELDDYERLTRRIGQTIGQGASFRDDGPLQMLLIRRARLLKQARRKVPMALDILEREYRAGDRWLPVQADPRNPKPAHRPRPLRCGCMASRHPQRPHALEHHRRR